MATTCPSCGLASPESVAVCASCGWDTVTRRHIKPPAADLLFKPSAPEPPPVEFVDTHAPVDPFAARSREREEAEKNAAAALFPPWFPPALMEFLQESEGGRRVAAKVLSVTASAQRDPSPFIGGAVAVAALGVAILYFAFRPAPPPPVKPPPPPESTEYVRRAATFAPTPNVVVIDPNAPPIPAAVTTSTSAPASLTPPAPATPAPAPR
jgi:hypothetical protein